MGWISEVSNRFADLLYPDELQRKASITELRAADVAEATISVLYPCEPFPHAALVSALLREPSFTLPARIPANDIHLRKWLSLAPAELSKPVADRLRPSYAATGAVTFFDCSDPQNWHVLLQLNAAEEAAFSHLAYVMLLLPSALDALGQLPTAFGSKLGLAERPLRNLLALVEAQLPFLAEARFQP